jgi:molecular chaperone Hsp33
MKSTAWYIVWKMNNSPYCPADTIINKNIIMTTEAPITIPSSDSATPFIINDTNLRGTLVRLDSTLNEILTKHDYPEPVSRLLGEVLLLVSMLGETLKFEGIITIQIKSDGPIEFLVADYATGGKIRGYASIDAEKYAALPAGLPEEQQFKALIGEGYFAITLDQGADMQRYQGVVPLEGGSISELAETYFSQSEQLQTALNIKVGQQLKEGVMQWCGGGIMLQRLPETIPTLEAEDVWEKAKIFLATIQIDELIDPLLKPETLLYRLFHEDGVWVYDPRHLIHQCRCSRQRAENILVNLTPEERESMLVGDEIIVTCQFCNKEEVFTESDF